ncbi:MAG TPA: metalloprotease family protein [Herpetosiphonaceae bacterium]|nr:metalloprotease family protein [Herpetosiphonaceae bacterium]
MSQPPRSSLPDNSSLVEGLPGRLPFLVSGLILFLSTMILLRIRNVLHADAASIDFEELLPLIAPTFLALVVLAPLMHLVTHALALLILRVPLRWERRLIFPQVRPGRTVSRAEATRILLAPLVFSLLLLLALAVRPLSAYAALWNAMNLALSVNDIWKAIGLRRFPPAALVEMKGDQCRLVER